MRTEQHVVQMIADALVSGFPVLSGEFSEEITSHEAFLWVHEIQFVKAEEKEDHSISNVDVFLLSHFFF